MIGRASKATAVREIESKDWLLPGHGAVEDIDELSITHDAIARRET
jgi:hypothetical protein